MYMALLPGEAFQHVHADQSITILVEGRLELEAGGQRVPLLTGQPTPIDANLPHRLVNVGTSIAIARCVHIATGHPTTA
jgi:quercetin dioxygenase-like cupin family protein